jgi:hypothetical protein
MAWYTYISGDPRVAGSYYLSTMTPTCLTGTQICAVFITDTNQIPSQANLDPRLQNISNALMTQVPQPTGIGVKRLVYLKSNC